MKTILLKDLVGIIPPASRVLVELSSVNCVEGPFYSIWEDYSDEVVYSVRPMWSTNKICIQLYQSQENPFEIGDY